MKRGSKLLIKEIDFIAIISWLLLDNLKATFYFIFISVFLAINSRSANGAVKKKSEILKCPMKHPSVLEMQWGFYGRLNCIHFVGSVYAAREWFTKILIIKLLLKVGRKKMLLRVSKNVQTFAKSLNWISLQFPRQYLFFAWF